MPKLPGLVKGLGVTMGTMLRTFKDGANTVQYPHVKETPPIRARGVIALHEGNCTVCMLCARSCPDWCIYIEGHKTLAPPRRAGGKPRQVSHLDRFDIDYALCMYCGICVEVCPFDALVLEPGVRVLRATHRRPAARQDQARRVDGDCSRGARARGRSGQEVNAVLLASDVNVAQNVGFYIIAAAMVWGAIRVVSTNNVVHAALWLVVVLGGVAAQYILAAAEFVAVSQVLVYIGAVMVLFLFGIMLTRATVGPDTDLNNKGWAIGIPVALGLLGVLAYAVLDLVGDDVLVDRDQAQIAATTTEISDAYLGDYLVPLIALSFVLLAAADRRHRPGPQGLSDVRRQLPAAERGDVLASVCSG